MSSPERSSPIPRSDEVDYRFSDIPPVLLLGAYAQEFDPLGLHYKQVLPHLLGAYAVWQDQTKELPTENVDEYSLVHAEKSGELNTILVSYLRMIYQFSFNRVHLLDALNQTESINFEEVWQEQRSFTSVHTQMSELEPLTFTAEVYPDNTRVLSPKTLGETYDAWESFFLHKYWDRFYRQTGIPFAMEFERPQPHFPQAIVMGELVLEKFLDKYMLPTFVRDPVYRDKFYSYLADKYEKEADMGIKTRVLSQLFDLMPGNNIAVLDAGCGTGLAYVHKPTDRTIRMLGVDASPEMAAIAQARGEQVGVGRIEDVGRLTHDALFDHAIMSFVDYWVAEGDKPVVFSSLKSVIKPGGRVVFNIHHPHVGWQEHYTKLLIEECGYRSVAFSQEEIARTNGGVYSAYYVTASV